MFRKHGGTVIRVDPTNLIVWPALRRWEGIIRVYGEPRLAEIIARSRSRRPVTILLANVIGTLRSNQSHNG
jgi:hypothetical protein